MNEPIISRKDATGSHTLQVISKANRFTEWMYDAFRQHLKGNVLEIGSGIGNISRLVIRDKKHITLSDYNPEYTNWLKKEFQDEGFVSNIFNIDLVHPAFQREYHLQKEKFDSVFLLNVLEHLEDDRKSLENCLYLLKPGGNLVLLVPAYPALYCKFDKELGHHRRYTSESLEQLVKEKDMKILEKQYFNVAGIGGWLLYGKILNKKQIGENEMSAFNRIVPVAKILDKMVFHKAGLSLILAAQKI